MTVPFVGGPLDGESLEVQMGPDGQPLAYLAMPEPRASSDGWTGGGEAPAVITPGLHLYRRQYRASDPEAPVEYRYVWEGERQ